MISSDRIEKTLSLIGRMCLEWNEAEVSWFLIYTILVHELPRPVAEAIFKRNTTGNGQRDLIIAIASVVLSNPQHTYILDYLVSAKNETNNLALERNDIVHGDYHYIVDTLDQPVGRGIGVRLGPGDDKARRANIFAGKDLEADLPELIRDISALGDQLNLARQHLLWSFLPADKRPHGIPESTPLDVRRMLLAASPSRAPPERPLIWSPIRPTARTQR
jgi:hypothetical protein